MDGADDLAAVNALQADTGDAEVGVSELALDHNERNALVRHLDGLSVAELVRRQAATHARAGLASLLIFPGIRRHDQISPRERAI